MTNTGYVIAFYLPEQVGAKNVSTGLYAVTGTPFKTFTIEGNAETGKLTVTEQAEGRAPYVTRLLAGNGRGLVHVPGGRGRRDLHDP